MNKLIVLIFMLVAGPAWSAETVSLAKLKSIAGTEGKVEAERVFVYFWASWCPECREKFADGALTSLQKDFPKAKVLTVNADRTEDRGREFAQDQKLAFPVYRDDDKTFTKSLKIFGVPGWAILNHASEGQWTVQKSAMGADLTEIRKELARPM